MERESEGKLGYKLSDQNKGSNEEIDSATEMTQKLETRTLLSGELKHLNNEHPRTLDDYITRERYFETLRYMGMYQEYDNLDRIIQAREQLDSEFPDKNNSLIPIASLFNYAKMLDINDEYVFRALEQTRPISEEEKLKIIANNPNITISEEKKWEGILRFLSKNIVSQLKSKNLGESFTGNYIDVGFSFLCGHYDRSIEIYQKSSYKRKYLFGLKKEKLNKIAQINFPNEGQIIVKAYHSKFVRDCSEMMETYSGLIDHSLKIVCCYNTDLEGALNGDYGGIELKKLLK